MKITEVRTIVTCPGRNYVVVKIMTDEGIYGVGEGTLNGSELAVAQAIDHASHLLLGRDPQRIEEIWQLLYHWSYWRSGPVYMAALAAIDIALWDIKGKIAGLPVYQLLGGRAREGVLCYGHANGRTIAELIESVQRFQSQGYKVIRVQMGPYGGPGILRHEPPLTPGTPPTAIFDPTPYLIETPRMFEQLRARLGMAVELCHDVHEQLTPQQAAWLAKRLEDYRLFFLEDPVRPEFKEGLRLVREASTTPLAMGELFTSRAECLPLFQNQWIDFIRITPIHVGGLTEARKICVLAEPYQVRTAFHGAADIGPIGQAAALHLQVIVPNFGVQEWTDFTQNALICEVFPTPAEFRDGYAQPPERPGIGVDINEEAARRYPYQRAFMPLVRLTDGSVHVY
jgi:mannonate dehydratase